MNLAVRTHGCRHVRAARRVAFLEDVCLGLPLSLQGFLQLMDVSAWPPERECGPCQGDEGEDPHMMTTSIDHQLPDTPHKETFTSIPATELLECVVCDDLGDGEDGIITDPEDNIIEGVQRPTEADDNGPTVADIVNASKAMLRHWCLLFGLPTIGKKGELVVRLLSMIEGELSEPKNRKVPIRRSRMGTPKTAHKDRGQRLSIRHEMLRTLREGRCIDGDMCSLYRFEIANCAKQENTTVLPLGPHEVDDILYAQKIALTRKSATVVGLLDGSFYVLRSLPTAGKWSSHAGYNLVHLRLRRSFQKDIRLTSINHLFIGTTCTCAEFRSQAMSAGGKSKSGGARLCLDVLMVLAGLALNTWHTSGERPSNAYQSTIDYLQSLSVAPHPMHHLQEERVSISDHT